MFPLTHLIRVLIAYLVSWLKNRSKPSGDEIEKLAEEGDIKNSRKLEYWSGCAKETYLLTEKGSRMSFSNTDFSFEFTFNFYILCVHKHAHPILSVEVQKNLQESVLFHHLGFVVQVIIRLGGKCHDKLNYLTVPGSVSCEIQVDLTGLHSN